MSPNLFEYGSVASVRFWQRFDFAVATISIVRVIFRVLSTERILRFSSRALAIER